MDENTKKGADYAVQESSIQRLLGQGSVVDKTLTTLYTRFAVPDEFCENLALNLLVAVSILQSLSVARGGYKQELEQTLSVALEDKLIQTVKFVALVEF